MAKEEVSFEDFLQNVDPIHWEFAHETHEMMLQKAGMFFLMSSRKPKK